MAVVVCDLDGVMWRGDQPIAGSANAVSELRGAGHAVAFLTNNSSATVDSYVEKLGRCGVEVTPEQVLTSAATAAELVARDHPAGGRVLACAGAGVVDALENLGFEVVSEGPAAAVVVGWHRDFDFEGLTRAARAIREGAAFVATNLDPTFPSPDGFLPGNGAIVAAVATASAASPVVAGKPEQPTAQLVHERFGASGVMVGDRPSTDGAMADALGWPFALVLSGVAGPGGDEPVPDPPPAFVASDLAAVTPMLLAYLGTPDRAES